jgi:hypothetical protein
VDPVPDFLLLRKSGRAENRTRDLWICSQKLLPLHHRGGPPFLVSILIYFVVYSLRIASVVGILRTWDSSRNENW